MRLIVKLAWRQLAWRPAATLLAALGIAVGIATVVSVLVVDHNTLLSQYARRIPSDPESDLLIAPLVDSPAALDALGDELRATEFLRGVAGFATASRVLHAAGQQIPGVEVMAVDEAAREHHAGWAVAQGEDLDFASGEPALLLSEALAGQLGLLPGDLVELARPVARSALRVDCIDGELVVTPPEPRAAGAPPPRTALRVAGLLAPWHLGYDSRRVLVSTETGRALFGPEFRPRWWADFDPRQLDFAGVEKALRDRAVVYEPKRALVGEAPAEAAFRSGVRLCAFLALFLGLYVIFNTMSMSLVERVRQIGLLRALGLTRGRLLAIFLVEGLVLALLGAALSVPLAERIVEFMRRFGITTLGFGKPLEIREVPWAAVGAVTAAGAFFALLGIVWPFLRASRLSVIDALRRGVIEMSSDPFTGARRTILLGLLLLVPVAWVVGAPGDGAIAVPLWEAFLQAVGLTGLALALLLLLPALLPRAAAALLALIEGPSALLARATVLTARHRVFANVSGLMLVFAAIFLVVSVLESLKGETRRFNQTALHGRLYLRTSAAGGERLHALRDDRPELAELAPADLETTSPFIVRAVDPRLLQRGPLAWNTRVREDFARGDGLLLSTRCADDFGYAVGDVVTLATPGLGAVELPVLAISDAYGFAPDDRVWAAVSAESMRRMYCLDESAGSTLFVAWAPDDGGDAAGAAAAAVGRLIGEDELLSVERGEEIGARYLADLDRNFAIFYAILLLTVLLATVGVLNAMTIAVLERRREIGLLRSVGLTGGQIARMLLAESGAFGVLGGLLGLALGLPLAVVCTAALTELSHLDLTFVYSPRALAAVLGGALLVALVAVLGPALRARWLPLSSVMRSD